MKRACLSRNVCVIYPPPLPRCRVHGPCQLLRLGGTGCNIGNAVQLRDLRCRRRTPILDSATFVNPITRLPAPGFGFQVNGGPKHIRAPNPEATLGPDFSAASLALSTAR
jgi:hypothetical protein